MLVLCVVACAWCAAAEPPFPWCLPVIPPNDPVSGTTQAAQLCAPAAHESLVRQLAQAWGLLQCQPSSLEGAGNFPGHSPAADAATAAALYARVRAHDSVTPSIQVACALCAASVLLPTAAAVADLATVLCMHGTDGLTALVDARYVAIAAELSREATRLDARVTEAHLVAATSLALLGHFDAAADAYQRIANVVRAYPAPPDATYLHPSNVTQARETLMYRLSREVEPNFRFGTTVKLEHDAAQFRYLVSLGVLPGSYMAVADEFDALRHEQEAIGTLVGFRIPATKPLVVAAYGRNVYVRHTPALAQSALGSWTAGDVMAQYLSSHHGIAVIDNAFSPEALEELLAFCEESTIWHDDGPNDYVPTAEGEAPPASGLVRGYLGAYLQEGFASGLLLQVAEEMRQRLPDVFQNHTLKQAWAYKYNSTKAGINVHGDDAAINCNCWITPDEFNLDPESGGMVVYDKAVPQEWTFSDFNSSPTRIMEWLSSQRPRVRVVKVPHRQNRCVIFNSNLLHRTDHLNFKPGLRSRRINLTLLFGTRQASQPASQDSANHGMEL